MLPNVCVVILNWNKKDDVLSLLDSLKSMNYSNYHIVVVDNASTDGSAEAIIKRFPEITVIKNKKNLGGTGGFNTGIKHGISNDTYKYIWLLDNDAAIDNNSLTELVKVMEKDTNIGIAGSRIVDPSDQDITVELGANIDWSNGVTLPCYKNQKNISFKSDYHLVDYVAICSALVRVSAINKIGLMDKRFFFFWDDMEWGARFKKNNYKVVAVPASKVVHQPFSEKRSVITDTYYGIRNPLLTFSLHIGLLRRLKLFYSFLRFFSKVAFIKFFHNKYLLILYLKAIFDFCCNRWGALDSKYNKINLDKHPDELELSKFYQFKKVLILPSGSKDMINEIYCQFSSFKDLRLSLLIPEDRESYFNFNHKIIYSEHPRFSVIRNSILFLKLLFMNFDLAISPDPTKNSPFSFIAKHACHYDPTKKFFRSSSNSRRGIWKLFLSIFLSEILAILTIIPVFLGSLRYRSIVHD